MYKVFIVEDEHLIRDSLRNQLLSLAETHPLIFSGEASDGEMALASIMDVKPDILLTDIRMPFMDGLSLAKEVRKIFPWIRIIFISGFDDFEYARTAIQVQADAYLLKPIKDTELIQTLEAVITVLEKQKEPLMDRDPQADNFVFELKKNHFLNGIFRGELSVPEVLQESAALQRSIVGKKTCVVLATNHYDKNFDDYFRFSNYLHFLFGADESIIFSSISSRFIKFLLMDSDTDRLLEKSYQLAQTLVHELKDEEVEDLIVSIGPIVERLSEIPQAYRYTQNMLQTYGVLRTERIISYEDDIKDGEVSPTNPFKLDLAQKIAQTEADELEELVLELQGTPGDTEERNRLFRFFVLTELGHLVQKKKPGSEQPLLEKMNDLDQLAAVAADAAEYTQIIEKLLAFLMAAHINPSMVKYQSVIQKALGFIKENFTDPDISLNVVADAVNLSPSHFSTIFSQSLGQTFIDFLTECRLQHAKELLVGTDDKLSSIAMDIGYNDPNYFSYLFKKREGVTPKEFRRTHTRA